MYIENVLCKCGCGMCTVNCGGSAVEIYICPACAIIIPNYKNILTSLDLRISTGSPHALYILYFLRGSGLL